MPAGVVSARWLVRPLRPEGSRLVPGPTDTILFAYLETEPDFWSKQGHLFAAQNGPVKSVLAADAKVLVPAAVLAESTLNNDQYQMHCDRLDPRALSSATHRAVMALHCGTGLLVAFRGQ